MLAESREDLALQAVRRLVHSGNGVGGLNEHSGAIRPNPFRCAYHLSGFFHGVREMPHMVYKLDAVGRRRWLVGQLTADDMAEGITRKPISRHGWSPLQRDAQQFGSEPEARAAADAVEHAAKVVGLCQVMEVA